MRTRIPYLDNHRWTDLSREERFFCAELYFVLSRMGGLRHFIEWMNANCGMSLPVDDEWDVGFEVCFYRDLIHSIGLNGTKSIRDKKVPGTEDPFMFKRTFDLALFHPERLVIIEAKAQQGLDDKQLTSFARDARDVRALVEAMGRKSPQVDLVLLAQQRYFDSTRNAVKRMHFTGMFSWGMLAAYCEQVGADAASIRAFHRAEEVR